VIAVVSGNHEREEEMSKAYEPATAPRVVRSGFSGTGLAQLPGAPGHGGTPTANAVIVSDFASIAAGLIGG
jgi:hypothetical protein